MTYLFLLTPPIIVIVGTLFGIYIVSHPVLAHASGNFSTYSKNDLGFTILYPSDWEVQEYSFEGTDTRTVHLAPYNDATNSIVVDITPSYTSNVTLNELANKVDANNPDSLYYAMDLRVSQIDTANSLGGYPAVRVVASYPVGQTQMGLVYQATLVHGTIYEVKLNAEASQMPIFSPIYEQMVNSFQIMNQ